MLFGGATAVESQNISESEDARNYERNTSQNKEYRGEAPFVKFFDRSL